jgi:integrase-like protein
MAARARQTMPVGPLFCVINGPSRGRAWNASAARAALHRRAAQAGVRRRFAPHQLRHAHALELLREGVPLNVIQRQLGHRNLGATSIYLQGIDPNEIIETVHARRPPMIPASVGLTLPARCIAERLVLSRSFPSTSGQAHRWRPSARRVPWRSSRSLSSADRAPYRSSV